jgi:DNA-binding NarL/FixJ family response regulator
MRILFADDHELLRDTLCGFLRQQDGLVVHEAGDLDSALRILENEPAFDMVLLDYTMPGMNGLDGLGKVLALPGNPPVALISGMARMDIAIEALRLGAQGFVQKTMPARSVLNAIRFMATGERFIPVEEVLGYFETRGASAHESAPAPAEPGRPIALTRRERDVLEALCNGNTNKQIARDLNLSEPTIKLHVKTLYRRLGATNRTQAAMIARDMGLF